MNTVRPFVTVLILVAVSAVAKERPRQYVHRPVSVSFVPGFSTSGGESRNASSTFSLNIVGGYLGRVRGAELGGVFNIDEDDVLGYQAAGAFNMLGGSFTGLQQAGAVNIVGEEFTGVQMAGAANVLGRCFGGVQAAGAANVVGRCFTGLQMTGAVNVVGNEVYGAQLAGAVNVAGGHTWGAQLAGAANVAHYVTGLQLAGAVNVAEEFEGLQVGVVNIAEDGHGLQLGVVNIAEDVDVPIGLVSIVGNGQFHFNVWTSDFSLFNVGVKTGSRIVYNVFMLGYGTGRDENRLYAGIGIGGHIPLNRFFVDVDVLSHGVFRDRQWFEDGGSDLLSSLRLTGGWQITDFLAVTAGPTLNVSVFDDWDSGKGEEVDIWPGFTIGLQLL